jgi:hypothetical protein
MRKTSKQPNWFEQTLRFTLDNLLDILTIVVAAVLVTRYNIHQPTAANTSEILTSVLAVLGLIAVSGIWDRSRRIGRIENLTESILQNTQTTKEALFTTDFSASIQKEIEEKIETSKDLLIIGNNLGSIIKLNYSLLENRLKQQKTIRIVLAKPNTPASDMAVSREYLPIDPNLWQMQTHATLNTLVELKKKVSDKLIIRVVETYLTHGIILADTDTNNGSAYCWMYSFKTRKGNRPKFVLRPTDDYWYDHFVEEAEAIWHSAKHWEPKP